MTWNNKLYFGDNLTILREHVQDDSVDLVYLDPPFNSAANYNVLFQETTGAQSAAQITAFEDTWHWTPEAETIFHELITSTTENLASLMQAMRGFLGNNDLMAYLVMMAPRLVELHRVLKATGTIYLHCDPTASHYLKLIMDAIFHPQNYRNEVIWKRATTVKGNFGQGSKLWGRATDTILFYSKTDDYTFKQPFKEYSAEYIASAYRHIEPNTGRHYRLVSMIGPGGAANGNPYYEVMGVSRYWRYSQKKMQELIEQGLVIQSKPGTVPNRKYYLDEGKGVPVQSLWDDIGNLQAADAERLGYPTQKPEALLERIITASSSEGDIVLDPFCGCGTTINVAERLHRHWIGIDVTHIAISLIKSRLHDTFKSELAPYEVTGDPKDLTSAEALALQDRYQFQWWAVGLVEGRPAQDKKKGKDSGIDGYIYFFDDNSRQAKKVIIQVKSGNVKSGDIRDLKGVLEREKAQIGAFITLKASTKDMRTEAVSAGFYEPQSAPGSKYPKLQILTIEELLNGAKLLYPQWAGAATFKRAERQSKDRADQSKMF
jgi:adenine specific DNA methylase Mod